MSVSGPRTFAGSLVLLFSSLWAVHLEDVGFDFIMIAPLLPCHRGLSVVLEQGISFLGEGFQHPPVNSCPTACCNFGVLTGEDEHMSFYSTILMDHSMDMCVTLSRVWLFVTPWAVACRAPLAIEVSRQECWGGLPFPSWPCQEEWGLPNPRIEPASPALQAVALLSEL